MAEEPDNFMPRWHGLVAALIAEGEEGRRAAAALTEHLRFVNETTETDAALLAAFVTAAYARLEDGDDLIGRALGLFALEYSRWLLGRPGAIRPGVVIR